MLTDDMKRLADDITASYDARMNFVNTIVQDTAGMLGAFRNDHSEMAQALRNQLEADFSALQMNVADFMSDTKKKNQALRDATLEMLEDHEDARLAAAKALKNDLISFTEQLTTDINNLLEQFSSYRAQMSADQRAFLSDFADRLMMDTANLLKEIGDAHAQMAKELGEFLADSESGRKSDFETMMNAINARISELRAATEGLLKESREAHTEMAKALRKMLETVTADRKADVADFMRAVADAHAEMAKELDNFLSSSEASRKSDFSSMMASITNRLSDLRESTNQLLDAFASDRTGMAQAWASLSRTLQARRSAGVAEVKKLEEKEAVYQVIADAANGGIKLTQIGKQIGKAWQGIIPLAGELTAEGRVAKDDDGFYHKT